MVAFSPDGSRLVSGSDDKTIRLWNTYTGRSLGEPIRGHQGEVRAIAFSPDGSRILSGSTDMTVRVWDAGINDANNINPHDRNSIHSDLREGSPLGIIIPGFEQCSLTLDGWVQSGAKRLFWVPPNNRHGIKNPRLLLTIPTSSPFRSTKLDLTHFQCGLSWTNVQNDIRR